MALSYFKLHEKFLGRFRRTRMHRFFATLAPTPRTRVLDVGGTEETWTVESEGGSSFPVTLLNILDYGKPPNDRFRVVIADATALPFEDGSFDIAFSNSVIEHFNTWQQQLAFAKEVRRVARQLWVQTPARHFPIESHLMAPLIHYLPRRIQHRLVRWTPRGLMQPAVVHQIVDEVRLLDYSEMQQLFPDCVILRERVAGLTKSFIAVRN